MEIIDVSKINKITSFIDDNIDKAEYMSDELNPQLFSDNITMRDLIFKSKFMGMCDIDQDGIIDSILFFQLDDRSKMHFTTAKIVFMHGVDELFLNNSCQYLFNAIDDINKISFQLVESKNKTFPSSINNLFTKEIDREINGISYKFYARFR